MSDDELEGIAGGSIIGPWRYHPHKAISENNPNTATDSNPVSNWLGAMHPSLWAMALT